MGYSVHQLIVMPLMVNIFNGRIFNNGYISNPAVVVIGYLAQALLVAVALPLLWKLPRVKRNMNE